MNIINCILTPHPTFYSKFFLIFYKLYISILFIGVTQQFSDVCFHCGWSNALDAEACKRKIKDYGIVHPICRPSIASGKKNLLELQIKMRKWNKDIHLSIYMYTLFRCFIKGSSILGHLKSKKKTTVLVL